MLRGILKFFTIVATVVFLYHYNEQLFNQPPEQRRYHSWLEGFENIVRKGSWEQRAALKVQIVLRSDLPDLEGEWSVDCSGASTEQDCLIQLLRVLQIAREAELPWGVPEPEGKKVALLVRNDENVFQVAFDSKAVLADIRLQNLIQLMQLYDQH